MKTEVGTDTYLCACVVYGPSTNLSTPRVRRYHELLYKIIPCLGGHVPLSRNLISYHSESTLLIAGDYESFAVQERVVSQSNTDY